MTIVKNRMDEEIEFLMTKKKNDDKDYFGNKYVKQLCFFTQTFKWIFTDF